jgi:hypothetical protein
MIFHQWNFVNDCSPIVVHDKRTVFHAICIGDAPPSRILDANSIVHNAKKIVHDAQSIVHSQNRIVHATNSIVDSPESIVKIDCNMLISSLLTGFCAFSARCHVKTPFPTESGTGFCRMIPRNQVFAAFLAAALAALVATAC